MSLGLRYWATGVRIRIEEATAPRPRRAERHVMEKWISVGHASNSTSTEGRESVQIYLIFIAFLLLPLAP